MDIPSLFMIPSAVSSGKVHSVFPNSTDADFDFARSSTASRVNSDGLIEIVASGQARLNYEIEGGLVNTKPSLLLEPQRTNAITNSDSFGSTGWSFVTTGSAIAPIVTDNYAISPDGTQNAQRIQFNLGEGNPSRTLIRQNIGSQTDWVLSVYMKSTNGQEQKILWHTTSDSNETTVTGEWQRFTFSRNGISNSWAGLGLNAGVSSVDTADILVYGFQAEQGSYITSLIPTNGSVQSRANETCLGAGTSSILPSEEGIFFAEIARISDDSYSNYELISLKAGSSGNTDNAMGIGFNLSSDRLWIRFKAGGGTKIEDFTTVATRNVFFKIAIKFKSGNNKIYVNGIEKVANTNTFSALNLHVLNFRWSTLYDFRGKVRDIRVYNTKEMTDSEVDILLTKITS